MIWKSIAFKLGFEAGLNIRSCGLDVKTISKSYKNPYGKETPEYSDFDFGKLEGYSKIPREYHYIQKPQEFGIVCPECKSCNLEWSEWEDHIWCNDCENETSKYDNPSSGPIPINLAYELGMSLDRWNLTSKKLMKFRVTDSTYHQIDEVEISGLRATFVYEKGKFFLKPVLKKSTKGEWWEGISKLLRKDDKVPLSEFQDFLNAGSIPLNSSIGRSLIPRINWFINN